VIFDGKRGMVRMDWADGEERNGREGYGGKKGGKGRMARIDWMKRE
jgi:hypothetical protein